MNSDSGAPVRTHSRVRGASATPYVRPRGYVLARSRSFLAATARAARLESGHAVDRELPVLGLLQERLSTVAREVAVVAVVRALVERFDIEPFSDFSAK